MGNGKPIALTPLLIEGRAESLAAENLHWLGELARLNGRAELEAWLAARTLRPCVP